MPFVPVIQSQTSCFPISCPIPKLLHGTISTQLTFFGLKKKSWSKVVNITSRLNSLPKLSCFFQ